MTNYEYIKQMDIKELATVLMCPYDNNIPADVPCKNGGEVEDVTTNNCIRCTMRYLKKEHENE